MRRVTRLIGARLIWAILGGFVTVDITWQDGQEILIKGWIELLFE